MHKYEIAILRALESSKELSGEELLEKSGLGIDSFYWAIGNLSDAGAIDVTYHSKASVLLNDEAKRYASSKLPETELLETASKGHLEVRNLDDKGKIGLQWAKTKGLIDIEKGLIVLSKKGKEALSKGIEEEIVLKKLFSNPDIYSQIKDKNKQELENLIKRKLISVSSKNVVEKIRINPKGLKMLESGTSANEIDSLTRKMISNKEWAGKKFKPYDVNVPVQSELVAKMHPLRGMMNKIKQSYVSMGFKETSGRIIIPAFWNFDTLFTPQDHPAREMQDTFYLSNPSKLEIGGKGVAQKVKKAHEEAWRTDWEQSIAMQGVLRTQTTSVSIHELYDLSKYKEYKLPLKLFSLGRVFRNENIDYKHLTDFYQTDGIIIGENLTLANLFDTLTKLYNSLGIKVKFKPAYFPFVEPGAEVYGYHEQRGEWLEIAGCGILRKEISGIAKKNITVLAWGSSVERLLLIKDPSIERLSDLYNNGIGWIRKKQMV